MNVLPALLSKKNIRKIEPKETLAELFDSPPTFCIYPATLWQPWMGPVAILVSNVPWCRALECIYAGGGRQEEYSSHLSNFPPSPKLNWYSYNTGLDLVHSKPLGSHSLGYRILVSRETTVADPGGGSRGSGPPPPIWPDACLRLEFLRWQD